MKNQYFKFDSVTEFGNLTEDFFVGRESFFAYIRVPRLDRVYRLEIRRTSGDFSWFVAKLFYKGARSPITKTVRLNLFAVVQRVYDLLEW